MTDRVTQDQPVILTLAAERMRERAEAPGSTVDRWQLAVADLLEEEARAFESYMRKQMDPLRRFNSLWLTEAARRHEKAIEIARAYLEESA